MTARKDEWILKEYRPEQSQQRWFFRKNLAPSVPVGSLQYPFVVYLTFHYVPRDDSGLPSNLDDTEFFRIEDQEVTVLEEDGLALQVASVLKSGVKDLIFYTCSPDEFLRRASRFRDTYPQYRVSCEITRDPKWEHYSGFP